MRRGQVVLEYFLIMAAIAALTLVALTTFDDDIRDALAGFFRSAAAEFQHD